LRRRAALRTCGGCAVQHLSADAYAAWKVDQVRQALSQRSIIDFDMKPLVSVAPRSRRRATLSAKQTRDGIVLGFQERGSTSSSTSRVPCHRPAARELVPKLREALAGELPRSGNARSV